MPIEITKKYKDVSFEVFLQLHKDYNNNKFVIEIYHKDLSEYSRIWLLKEDIDELIEDLIKLKNEM